MNKPVYLRLSILELSKIVVYEFYYDYGKLCHMDADNFIVYIKGENIYSDIAKDVETKFNT